MVVREIDGDEVSHGLTFLLLRLVLLNSHRSCKGQLIANMVAELLNYPTSSQKKMLQSSPNCAPPSTICDNK